MARETAIKARETARQREMVRSPPWASVAWAHGGRLLAVRGRAQVTGCRRTSTRVAGTRPDGGGRRETARLRGRRHREQPRLRRRRRAVARDDQRRAPGGHIARGLADWRDRRH